MLPRLMTSLRFGCRGYADGHAVDEGVQGGGGSRRVFGVEGSDGAVVGLNFLDKWRGNDAPSDNLDAIAGVVVDKGLAD